MSGWMRASMVLTAVMGGLVAFLSDAQSADGLHAPEYTSERASGPDARHVSHRWRTPHFIPNSQRFWDNSEHWTTNYGPAYRDTNEGIEGLVPCTGEYALCFHSGAEPYPCELERNGRFANCTCTVQEEINYVLISAILNYQVYLDTIDVCGADGSGCYLEPDKAPVCEAIHQRKLIRGAKVISTFSGDVRDHFEALLSDDESAPDVTNCPKGAYAGCMTAPCKKTRSGDAVCSCPVFYGPFQLTGDGAECTLDHGLVNSASYTPALDRAGTSDGDAE